MRVYLIERPRLRLLHRSPGEQRRLLDRDVGRRRASALRDHGSIERCRPYDIAPDGERFLFIVDPDPKPLEIRVFVNGAAELVP